MRILLDTTSSADYQTFLQVKSLPKYHFEGRTAIVPNEYAARLGRQAPSVASGDYRPSEFLFDYQGDITALAIRKRKFCIFADCGLGKTLMFLEYARHVAATLSDGRCVLIVSPLMVIEQTLAECERWYHGTMPLEWIRGNRLQYWLNDPEASRVGITNYDSMHEKLSSGRLGCLILDESSYLKSAYGKWGQVCLRLGKGLDWKLAGSGTPAPNDRIEYGNHAVLMDAEPNLNSFLARYFVNRGQTGERWELKPHALRAFYRALSHWCIFLTNPAVYGWQHNAKPLPPIQVHIHDVDLTQEQQNLAYERTGRLFADQIGGIVHRGSLGQIAKGHYKGRSIGTNKPAYIRQLVESWPGESTIIWCLYNREQEGLEALFPDAASIHGKTPYETRARLIAEFKAGKRRVLISKPKVLGFGLNLEVATRQVFSGLQDSFESYYQCVKRSNRYGAKSALHVHIPVTDLERPMIETVLRKAHRVQADTEEQERLFAHDK